jgi:RTX calcium-binding nonapeptide repeat (4 copies)
MTVVLMLGLMVSLTHAQDVAPEVEPTLIVGTDAGEVLPGTPERDSLYGRGGDDALLANAGDDELDGGPGADKLSGGPGRDAVSYEGAAGVDVTLDNVPNDGAPGEGDNVLVDTEDVYGTEGPDAIIGNGLANTLDGNGGDDQIVGGPGADGLFGGEGNDDIFSRDGSADRIECGPGFDNVNVDARDTYVDCEVVGRVPATENFAVNVRGRAIRRASRFEVLNVLSGSRVTFACVSRCRPRIRSTRILYRRVKVRSVGGQRLVRLKVPRSRLVAGATFEIGVKARKATPRCRRFKLSARGELIADLIASRKRCTSIARRG